MLEQFSVASVDLWNYSWDTLQRPTSRPGRNTVFTNTWTDEQMSCGTTWKMCVCVPFCAHVLLAAFLSVPYWHFVVLGCYIANCSSNSLSRMQLLRRVCIIEKCTSVALVSHECWCTQMQSALESTGNQHWIQKIETHPKCE